jgi:hypothetical protein
MREKGTLLRLLNVHNTAEIATALDNALNKETMGPFWGTDRTKIPQTVKHQRRSVHTGTIPGSNANGLSPGG